MPFSGLPYIFRIVNGVRQKDEVFIIARNHRLNQLEHNFHIKVKDQPLLRLNSYRYLGVDVDETLSWQT